MSPRFTSIKTEYAYSPLEFKESDFDEEINVQKPKKQLKLFKNNTLTEKIPANQKLLPTDFAEIETPPQKINDGCELPKETTEDIASQSEASTAFASTVSTPVKEQPKSNKVVFPKINL